MSSLTWLDFSDAERKRALQVLELLGRGSPSPYAVGLVAVSGGQSA